jgi:hypothetical protein
MASNIITHTTRNHALEHATVNVLNEKHQNFSAQGNSAPWGFYLNIYSAVSDEDVTAAVEEAYQRLKNGERKLALHPNCGTVLLTTATMATLAAQTTVSLERRRRRRPFPNLPVLINALPAAVLAVLLTLIASRPLGMVFQERFTVNADLGDLKVKKVKRVSPSPVSRFFQYLMGHSKNANVNSFKIETTG